MIYLKSLIAGMVAVPIVLVILALVLFAIPVVKVLVLAHTADGMVFFNGPYLSMRPVLVGASVVFAMAFYWTFRRTSRRSRRA